MQFCLIILPVRCFTFSFLPITHQRPSRIDVNFPSATKRCNQHRSGRISCLKIKRGEIEDDDVDDYYTPRPARASQEPSRRSTRPGKQFYTPYYEERYADKNFAVPDPLRPNDDNQKLAPYLSQSNFEDDDDYEEDDYDADDRYYDDEEEDFRKNDDEESNALGGNFWSNPKGGIDRSMRPPTPPTPRLTRPRKRPVDNAGPNSKRRRR